MLLEIAKHIADFISSVNSSPTLLPAKGRKKFFVKAGAPAQRKTSKTPSGVLQSARDWVFDFDLPDWSSYGQYAFPHDVSATSRVPDGYIISRETKQCIVLELTSPLEENIAEWNMKKTKKYREDIASVCEDGWTVTVMAIEVGAKGWIPPPFRRAFKQLGLPSPLVRRLSDGCQLIARKCSYLIWINRYNLSFLPWRLTVSGDLDAKWRAQRSLQSKTSLTAAQHERSRVNKQKAKDTLIMSAYPDILPSSSVTEQQLQRIHEQKAKAEAILEMKRREKLPPGTIYHALKVKVEPENCHKVNDDKMSRYPDTLPSSSVTEQQLRQIQEKKAKAKAILKMKKRQRTRLPPGPLCHALEAKPEPNNCQVNDEETAFLQDMENTQNAEEAAFLQDLEEEAAFLQYLGPEDHSSSSSRSKFKIQDQDPSSKRSVSPKNGAAQHAGSLGG